jgi:hypothetical protein
VTVNITQLNKDTRVHIILIHNGMRCYLNRVETARRPSTGDLYLKGSWNTDHRQSRSQTFETATLIRERLKRENGLTTYIAFEAGDAAELIQE